MEIFIVILLLFIVTFLLASKNNLSDKLHHLSSKIDQMKTELKELKNSINNKECQVQVFKNESDHSNPPVDSKQKTETSFAHAYKKPEIILEQILNTPI